MSNTLNPERSDKGNALQRLSYHVSTCIGTIFYKLGFIVASNPWKTITLSWIIVFLCCTGLLRFHNEKDPLKLWVPKNSDFLKHTKFIMQNFEIGMRAQSVIIVADDVLEPNVMKTLSIINKEINDMKTTDLNNEIINLDKMCFKIPIISGFSGDEKRRRKRRSNDFDDTFFDDSSETDDKKVLSRDPIFLLDVKQYCGIVEKLPTGCMKESFLELWNSNDETIKNLTKNDIIKKLNATKFSPETGHQMDFSSLLGDIERDNSGMIISGRSILMSFNLFINFTEVESQDTGNSAGTEDWATVNTMLLEAKFLEVMERLKRDLENDKMKIYYTAGRSFGDISSTTMFKDIDKLFIGVTLMIIYMVFVLSKYGWTEIRFLLTMFGMMSCAMAFISGCGISSFFLFYSPVHTSLPFLLMGLGVDDIFVIMSAFRRVPNDRPLPERIATCLQHAGASITVTSLTDILAFLVGGTTILPSLQSFCLFASICIFMTYIFVATFFVAILTLDERRLQQNRNGCIPCIKHKGQTDLWCEPNLMLRSIRSIYSNVILTKPGKIFVIISAFVISIFCLRHVFMLTQKFDSTWFIPSSSYYFEYVMKYRFYYPDRGYEAQVIMGNLNYTQEMTKILLLSEQIKNETNVLDNVQSWIIPFRDFVNINFNLDIRDVQMTDSQFKYYLSKFLYSATGGRYQANVRFKEKLVCGQATSDIKISSITFRFHKFSDRDEYLPAKKTIERLIKEANFTSNHETFLWAKIFANWITDEIIDEEIFRNIALALFGVFICTAIMIVNLQVCLYIFTCVLLTMISIGGLMQVWGLTLDLVTCISLQLAVGLCVDYAAHIGHTFLTISEGDGNQRALKTVENIGAAVLQGGFSTLLAVTLLSFSDAYTYQTFFKIFTIVVFFGLYYGIVFLPVILSIVPPKPYDYKMHKTIRLQKIDINNDTPLELLNKSNIEDTNFDVKVNDENCDENGKINLNY